MRILEAGAILLSALLLVACSTAYSSSVQSPSPLILRNRQWSVRVDPARLAIWGRLPETEEELTLAAPAEAADEISGLAATENHLSWSIPQKRMRVEIRLSDSRLRARFTTDKEQTLNWPQTGTKARALIWSESAGLYIPADDPFWLARPAPECRPFSSVAR